MTFRVRSQWLPMKKLSERGPDHVHFELQNLRGASSAPPVHACWTHFRIGLVNPNSWSLPRLRMTKFRTMSVETNDIKWIYYTPCEPHHNLLSLQGVGAFFVWWNWVSGPLLAQSAWLQDAKGGCKAMANSPQPYSSLVDAVWSSSRGLLVNSGTGWNGWNEYLFGIVVRCSFWRARPWYSHLTLDFHHCFHHSLHLRV